ncbi:MAG: hypothetical protein L0H22_09975, partial [Brevibacterium aurantiacum]|nr:hypothetical protein [Brevibacterium aurantiacum]
MSTSRRPPPTPGLRLFAPLSVLGAAIVLALAVHPQWSTILIMAALAVLGAGRSLLRAEKWQPADSVAWLGVMATILFAYL